MGLPVLISLALLAQKLMDAGIMQKVRVPSISWAIDAFVQSYQRNAVPIVKRFRGLGSDMREKLVLSVPGRIGSRVASRIASVVESSGAGRMLRRVGSRIFARDAMVNMSLVKK